MSWSMIYRPGSSIHGLVEKKSRNSFRMIVDFSKSGSGVNTCIDDSFAIVSYSSLYDPINLLLECGTGSYMYKTDVRLAFRLVPLRPQDYHLCCISWNGKCYIDHCFPMGLRSACQTWKKISTALEFILSIRGSDS